MQIFASGPASIPPHQMPEFSDNLTSTTGALPLWKEKRMIHATLLRTALAATTMLACGASAFADPTGDWRVGNGKAVVQIKDCGKEFLCGLVSSATDASQLDIHNPDPSKRGRPILGIEVLSNLKQESPTTWTGSSYDAEDGQLYSARITLLSEQSLEIEGCIPGAGTCGKETWARVK